MTQPSLNIVDRAIAAIAPEWGLRRALARNVLNTYRGGVATRTGNPFGVDESYLLGRQSERSQVFSMRDRARQVERNNPIARSILNCEVDNVVADGMTVQARTESDDFNREAEERWNEWLDRAELRGVWSGVDLQRTPYRMHRRDGDCGIVLVSQGTESRLQLVPGDLIQTPYNRSTGNADIRDGVEVDARGKPVAYWIATMDELKVKAHARVMARDFVFLANTDNPLAARGESAFGQVFELLDQVAEYADAVVIAARMAAVFGLIFKESTAAKQFAGLGVAANSAGVNQKAVTLENGSVKYVGQADDVVQVQASQPMQQTPDFIRAMMRLIGMPFDMPLEIVAKDMATVNFASARIGLLQYYRSARVKQRKYGKHWSRIYQWWLSRERNKQIAGIDGAFVTPFPETYWTHQVVARGWPYTDPVSEAQGDLLAIEMGLKSPQMVAAERGEDWEEVRAQKEAAGWPTKAPRSTLTRDEQPQAQQPQQQTDEPDDDNMEPDDAA